MKSYKPKRLKSDNFKCDLCGIEVTSQQTMDIHIRGRKHMNKLNIKTVRFILGEKQAKQLSFHIHIFYRLDQLVLR